MFITAVEQLMEGNTAHKMNLGELVWLSVVMGIATAAKLALFVFCRTFKSPIVQAYSQVNVCRWSDVLETSSKKMFIAS